MSSPSRDTQLPLPSHWHRHVRSAIVHAASMAAIAFTHAVARVANHPDARIRVQAEIDRLRREVDLLLEEARIKDARMDRLPAQRRPHYQPIDRLAILALRAARGWSQAETARRLLVTPLTVASWTQRLDDEGPDALVQVSEPVNRFPELVSHLVRRLRTLCPTLGTRRIAGTLARAGLHLGATTVRRILKPAPKPTPKSKRPSEPRAVTAKTPNRVWHLDLTTVPTIGGFWISWWPFAIPQRWPFCWWVAVVVDHFSRRAIGTAHFKQEPSAGDVTAFLNRVCRRIRQKPGHLITDHGPQFTADAFIAWCHRRGIQQRFGAIGRYGSLAVIERFIKSLKNECTTGDRHELMIKLAAHRLQCNLDRREVSLHDFPDARHADPQVIVHEDVSESDETPPVDIPVIRLERIGQLHDRLSHRLQVVENRPLNKITATEFVLAGGCESLNALDAL